jgi:hypothetical protein
MPTYRADLAIRCGVRRVCCCRRLPSGAISYRGRVIRFLCRGCQRRTARTEGFGGRRWHGELRYVSQAAARSVYDAPLLRAVPCERVRRPSLVMHFGARQHDARTSRTQRLGHKALEHASSLQRQGVTRRRRREQGRALRCVEVRAGLSDPCEVIEPRRAVRARTLQAGARREENIRMRSAAVGRGVHHGCPMHRSIVEAAPSAGPSGGARAQRRLTGQMRLRQGARYASATLYRRELAAARRPWSHRRVIATAPHCTLMR